MNLRKGTVGNTKNSTNIDANYSPWEGRPIFNDTGWGVVTGEQICKKQSWEPWWEARWV